MRRKLLAACMAVCMLVGSIGLSAGAQENVAESDEAVSVYKESGQTVSTDGLDTIQKLTIHSDGAGGVSTYGETLNTTEWQLLIQTNKQRFANNLWPLSISEKMLLAASTRAEELTDYYDHTRPDGRDCFTVLDECDISYSSAGENIAAGQTSPENVLNSWMNSAGHRENILSENFVHLGTGYAYGGIYGHNWVQLFTGGCSPEITDVVTDEDGAGFYYVGTSIDQMSLILETYCDDQGYSYIPVATEMCDSLDVRKTVIQELVVGYNGQAVGVDIVMHPFKDVGNGWYTECVINCYLNGYMTGLNSSTFGISQPLSRSQFASILHRMNGSPEAAYTNKFKDVKNGEWYTEPVIWASSTGVVNGYENGNFGPADNITREQMAVMMHNYAKYKGYDTSAIADINEYSDAGQVSSYATEAMKWAVGSGIISGKEGGARLDPLGNASRAECAAIIMRFVQLYEE